MTKFSTDGVILVNILSNWQLYYCQVVDGDKYCFNFISGFHAGWMIETIRLSPLIMFPLIIFQLIFNCDLVVIKIYFQRLFLLKMQYKVNKFMNKYIFVILLPQKWYGYDIIALLFILFLSFFNFESNFLHFKNMFINFN